MASWGGDFAPGVYTQPASVTAFRGDTVRFEVMVSAQPTPTYQWRKNGVNIPGATTRVLVLNAVGYSAAGSYDVVVANTKGRATSQPAMLTVVPAIATITAPPASTHAFAGETVELRVGATGPNLVYQWKKNGEAIAGGTNASLTLAAVAGVDMGFYSVTIAALDNVVESEVAALTVASVDYEWTTLAGRAGEAGSADGAGSAARFRDPDGIAIGRDGTLYVADKGNSTIRRISPAGVVTTLAGSPRAAGHVDGSGSAARFSFPTDVAVDAHGNVLVADSQNYRIRRITPLGEVTTLAGGFGSGDGAAAEARFLYLGGLAVDPSGNIFVGDSGNHTIRKMTPDGAVTTLAGRTGNSGSVDGAGDAARFYHPGDVAVAGDGTLFVCDGGNHKIRQVSSDGVVTTFAGGGSGSPGGVAHAEDGPAGIARFNLPSGVAVDRGGQVFVTDWNNHLVRRITPEGVVSTVGGTAAPNSTGNGSADGVGGSARFNNPDGLAIDSNGVLYVTDSGNHTIRKGVPRAAVASRLANLATRAFVPAGGSLNLGFALHGSGAKELVVRAVGPALSRVGVEGALNDPKLALFAAGGTVPLFANDDWGATANRPALEGAMASVGAFPLEGDSKDAVALVSLKTASHVGYAICVESADPAASGVVLAEIYDVDPLSAAVRLANVSTLALAGTGANVLAPGFVIGGTEPKRLLIRAVGPGLASFGVEGTLADPRLAIVPLGKTFTVASNDNWDGSASLSAAFARAGAFALPAGSKDAALLVRLPPGGYTVQVSGAGNTTGTALVEIYDLDS
jgi:sugar lactone lactonase YvrE